jgi:hypothetical protein
MYVYIQIYADRGECVWLCLCRSLIHISQKRKRIWLDQHQQHLRGIITYHYMQQYKVVKLMMWNFGRPLTHCKDSYKVN